MTKSYYNFSDVVKSSLFWANSPYFNQVFHFLHWRLPQLIVMGWYKGCFTEKVSITFLHFEHCSDCHKVLSCIFTGFSILLYFLFTGTYFCFFISCISCPKANFGLLTRRQPILITLHFLIGCKGHQGPCNEVGFQNLTDSISGNQTRSCPTLTVVYCPTVLIGHYHGWLQLF